MMPPAPVVWSHPRCPLCNGQKMIPAYDWRPGEPAPPRAHCWLCLGVGILDVPHADGSPEQHDYVIALFRAGAGDADAAGAVESESESVTDPVAPEPLEDLLPVWWLQRESPGSGE